MFKYIGLPVPQEFGGMNDWSNEFLGVSWRLNDSSDDCQVLHSREAATEKARSRTVYCVMCHSCEFFHINHPIATVQGLIEYLGLLNIKLDINLDSCEKLSGTMT